nr:hypothetical protein [Tanacetum cinerariifolium]
MEQITYWVISRSGIDGGVAYDNGSGSLTSAGFSCEAGAKKVKPASNPVEAMNFPPMLRLRFEQEVRLRKRATKRKAKQEQRIQVREEEIKKLDQEVQGLQNQTSNLKNLLEAEMDMKKVAEAKNAYLTKELESLRTQFSDLQKYEDERVNSRCVEMDARLGALSIDFNEELYPHMLTGIAGHRWVIGHGLRLAVMKCGESPELRLAFANV